MDVHIIKNFNTYCDKVLPLFGSAVSILWQISCNLSGRNLFWVDHVDKLLVALPHVPPIAFQSISPASSPEFKNPIQYI